MLQIDEQIGAVVAADTKGAIGALDNAILSELRLCTTVVEVIQQSGVPIGSSQKLLQSLTSGLSQIVAGRADIAQTVRHLNAIKGRSSLAPFNFGCPDGWTQANLGQTLPTMHTESADGC
ncbi:hypothetical protein [Sphingorhabdus sp.]|uniref:hypothetical protein n=1 Tax=Sphingorhabdus sp. TaxID=1902408 RepID=UPI003BB1E8E9|nr:hypothetical protein [Sphingomonadales bacterium]MBK9431290.1 hypothetical protein [Sphingomonadales bacterium]MBL0022803.1 hypothetical protein [Sphingomonadales bacterium]